MSMNALSVHVSAEHVSTLSVSMSATVRTVLLEPTVNGVSVHDMAAIISMSTGKLPSLVDIPSAPFSTGLISSHKLYLNSLKELCSINTNQHGKISTVAQY